MNVRNYDRTGQSLINEWKKKTQQQSNTNILSKPITQPVAIAGLPSQQGAVQQNDLQQRKTTQVATAQPVETIKTVTAAVKRDRSVKPTQDDLITAIGKLGGINSDQAIAQWGNSIKDSVTDLNRHASREGKAGILHVVSSKGKDLDSMREALEEHGYLPTGSTIEDMYDAIDRHLAGKPTHSNQYHGQVEKQDLSQAPDDFDGYPFDLEGINFPSQVNREKHKAFLNRMLKNAKTDKARETARQALAKLEAKNKPAPDTFTKQSNVIPPENTAFLSPAKVVQNQDGSYTITQPKADPVSNADMPAILQAISDAYDNGHAMEDYAFENFGKVGDKVYIIDADSMTPLDSPHIVHANKEELMQAAKQALKELQQGGDQTGGQPATVKPSRPEVDPNQQYIDEVENRLEEKFKSVIFVVDEEEQKTNLQEGRYAIERIPETAERESLTGVIGAAARIAARSQGTVQTDQRTSGLSGRLNDADTIQQREIKALTDWAKQHDLFIDAAEFDRQWKEDGKTHGVEHDVYATSDGRVIKRSISTSIEKSWLSYFYRLALHNHLFGEPTAYKLKGFMLHKGELQAVIEQPFITENKANPATFDDIEQYMKSAGFERRANEKLAKLGLTGPKFDLYVKDGVVVNDLHKGNVLKGLNGALYFIDAGIVMDPENKQQRLMKRYGLSEQEPAVLQETPTPATSGSSSDSVPMLLGDKIGGARKDLEGSTEPSKPKKSKSNLPAWRRRYVVVQIITSNSPNVGMWTISDTTTGRPLLRKQFATQEEAEQFLPLAAFAVKHRVTLDSDKTYKIVRNVTDRKRVTLKDGFESEEAANRYVIDHTEELIEQNTYFGEEIIARPETVRREGPQRRERNATGQMFMDTFGFRSAEFGNWNNEAERQEILNHAFDSLLDMTELLNIPPKAVSLNGELAIAFGARGQGLTGAAAHYEPQYAVINLTKMAGAGHLFHEWLHAMDNYFARQDGVATSEKVVNKRGDLIYPADKGDMVSAGFKAKGSGVRQEVQDAFQHLMETICYKTEEYIEDTEKAERFVKSSLKNVTNQLEDIRRGIARERQYGAKKKPATADQLVRFDAIAEKLKDPQGQTVEWRHSIGIDPNKPVKRGNAGQNRWTNDTFEELGKLLKEITGRSGFSKEGHGELNYLVARVRDLHNRHAMLQEARNKDTKVKKVPTSFRQEAYKIDQGRTSDYWTEKWEMLARAGSAYIEDKLSSLGQRNDFLSFGSENKYYRLLGVMPFPEGKERKAINKAFDNLFDTIKTKETDKGIALYAQTENTASPAEQQQIQKDITGKSATEVLQYLIDNSPNLAFKIIAARTMKAINTAGMPINFTIAHVGDVVPESLINRKGSTDLYQSGKIEIRVNGVDTGDKSGMNMNILLHEFVHAATVGALNTQTPTPAIKQAIRDIKLVGMVVADTIQKKVDASKPLNDVEQQIADRSINALEDADEILTWGLTIPEFQNYLETIPHTSGSLWSRFVLAVRSLLGLHPKADTALSTILKAADTILDNPMIYGSRKGSMGRHLIMKTQHHSDIVKSTGMMDEAPKAAQHDQEYAEIETRYFNDDGSEKRGAMLAPNGKRSNLNKRQWIQVRTESFKKWFGDWEKAEVGTFLNGTPLKKLMVSDAPQEGFAKLREWATELFMAEPYNGVAVNPVLGEVLIDKQAVRASIAHQMNPFKAVAFAAVPDVIEKGRIINQNTTENTDSYYISAPVKIEGVDDIVTVLVKRDVNGQRFYLHSVTTKNNLLKTSQSSADAEASKQSRTVNPGGISNILQLLLQFNNNSVSKVVDANGEPLVVYHGTNNDFNEFDPLHGGQNFEYGEEIDVNRNAVFLSENKSFAQQFGNFVMPAFVSSTNPMNLRVQDVSLYEREFMEVDRTGWWGNSYSVGQRWHLFDGEDGSVFVGAASYVGYDGALMVESDHLKPAIKHKVVVAFSPTQIKSATGNTGAFDGNNPDIRYSLTSPTTTGLQAADLQKEFSGLPFASKIKVVQTEEELPGFGRQSLGLNIEGQYKDGTIYLVAGNLPSVERARIVALGHELTHAGQSEKLIDMAVKWFKDALAKGDNRSKLQQAAVEILEMEAVKRRYNLTKEADFRKAVEEATAVIAEIAYRTGEKAGLMTRLLMYLKHFMRTKLGWKTLPFTDKELVATVSMMMHQGERNLINGKGPDGGQYAIGETWDVDSATLKTALDNDAAPYRNIIFSEQAWIKEFGANQTVVTPLGHIKLGNNQKAKLAAKGRSQEFGLIKPTLETPSFVVEFKNDKPGADRQTSLMFVKAFKKPDKTVYFQTITVSKEGLEIAISSHLDRIERITEKARSGWLRYSAPAFADAAASGQGNQSTQGGSPLASDFIIGTSDKEVKGQFSLSSSIGATPDSVLADQFKQMKAGDKAGAMVRSLFDLAGSVIPPKLKANLAKILDNPWWGSEGNPIRRAIVNL